MFGELVSQIRRTVRDEQRSLYTFLPVIVESVNTASRTVEVSRKDDAQVLADDIPIATSYAGDGYGEIHPVSSGDEGFVHCATVPIEDLDERGHEDIVRHRNHNIRDGVFYLRRWFDDDQIPAHSEGDYVYLHASGTEKRISSTGTWLVETQSGASLSLTDGDGADVDATLTSGEADALRVDSTDTTTTESADPIIDPTDDSETTYRNPDQLRARGPVDLGFYETRRRLPDRRSADPDPTVTDESDPAYIALDSVPIGYDWVNTSTWEYKMWGSSSAPVVITTL